MKKYLLCLFGLLILSKSYCQLDTIYTYTEVIPCNVTEVGTDAVKFSYKGEELVNSIYKSTILKIIYKSGRIQKFAESTIFKSVKSVEDFEEVSLTQLESEIRGLFKIGEVSSSANGLTVYSSEKKVKSKAIKRIKIEAAMLGSNVVFLTQNTSSSAQLGYNYFNKTAEAKTDGVAYSNQIPLYDDFVKLVGNKTIFAASLKYSFNTNGGVDFSKTKFSKKVQLIKVYSEDHYLMINAKIDGVDSITFRVIYLTGDTFTICLAEKKMIFNYVIDIH